MKYLTIAIVLLVAALVFATNTPAKANVAIMNMNMATTSAATRNMAATRVSSTKARVEANSRMLLTYPAIAALVLGFDNMNKNPCKPTLKMDMSNQVMIPCRAVNKPQ